MSIEALSDSELRTKLAEYGYPVGPVTQTTRKILLKKLKNLMEDRGGSRFSMAAAKFSSDDTSDDDSSGTKKKKKAALSTRRQTLATTMPPPPPTASPAKSQTKKRLTRNMNSSDSKTENEIPSIAKRSPSKEKIPVVHIKTSRDYNSKDGLETGSDSDGLEELPQKQPVALPKFGVGTPKAYTDRTSSTTSADVNSPKSFETSWRRTLKDSYDNTSPNSLARDERYSINLPKPNTTLDSSRNDSLLSKDSSKRDDILGNYDSPYLSEFTRRLSVQSANLPSLSKPSFKLNSKFRLPSISGSPEVKESDSNGHFHSSLRSYPSSSGMTYITSSFDKTQRDGNKAYRSSTSVVPREEVKNNQNMISMILVVVVGLFFAVLAVAYLGLEGKTDFPGLPSERDTPLCKSGFDKPGSNCVPEEIFQDTLSLLKRLYPILMRRAVAEKCNSAKEPPYLSDKEIINMYRNSEETETKLRELLNMVHVLIIENPKWKLSLLEIPDDDSETAETLKTMDQVIFARAQGKVGVVMSEPDLPWQCQLKNQVFTVVTALLGAALGGLVVILAHKFYRAYWQHKEKREKEVFNLVSEIINMLELHHQSYATTSPGGTQESYLAINHIRDNLIPPKDRKRLAAVWEKAVKFLDENESRIRREVQLVAGEEFQVWRWLPSNASSNSPSSSPAPKMSKVWQGSAFETMEGSVNSPSCPPTPCLKIRHMFDPDVEFEDDWEIKVKDAILEKCGDGVKILHIKVDRGSREGCVYMKCMSQDDAGAAYNALHGFWFDGNLVTVKYLRLERYHERFPEAINFKIPLKPSNNQRLSMQA